MTDVAAAPTTGARAGFQSLEHESRIDRLPREGELPEWLRGALIRTGPASCRATGYAEDASDGARFTCWDASWGLGGSA